MCQDNCHRMIWHEKLTDTLKKLSQKNDRMLKPIWDIHCDEREKFRLIWTDVSLKSILPFTINRGLLRFWIYVLYLDISRLRVYHAKGVTFG